MLHDAQLSEEQGRSLGLQALLESEQVRMQEMKSTLDKERELYAQLQSREDGGQPPPALPSEDLLKELQKQLEEKHSRIVELLSETEKYKLDSLQARRQMEKDRQVHQQTLQTEQEANTRGQRKMQELQSKVEELQRQLQEKRQQVYKLDLEGKRLQGLMQEFQKQELEPEERRGSRGPVCHNLHEVSFCCFYSTYEVVLNSVSFTEFPKRYLWLCRHEFSLEPMLRRREPVPRSCPVTSDAPWGIATLTYLCAHNYKFFKVTSNFNVFTYSQYFKIFLNFKCCY